MRDLFRLLINITFAGILISMSNNALSSTHSFETSLDTFFNTSAKQFTRTMGGTSSAGTGPNGAQNGSWYVYMETSSGAAYSQGDTATLQKNSVSTNAMSFYYHTYGPDIGILAVEVYSGGVWQRVWQSEHQKQRSHATAWKKQTISFAFYPGTKSIRFIGVAEGGFRGDMAIDNVQFFNQGAATTLEYHYDELGRLVCAEDAVNGDISYIYDAAGNRSQVANGDCNG